MDRNGHQTVQVIINGHPQSQQEYVPNMAPQNLLRSLSVDEALQYSSMTSAPVFGLGSSFQNP